MMLVEPTIYTLMALSEKAGINYRINGDEEDDIDIRTLSGGILIQKKDQKVTDNSIKIVTKKKPTEQEMKDLKFAFTVCKHVKSNAIVYAKNGTTVGVGAGQMSRVNSSRIASWKAADQSKAAGEPVSRA